MAELLEAVKNFYDRKGTADGDDRATGVDDGGSEALSKARIMLSKSGLFSSSS